MHSGKEETGMKASVEIDAGICGLKTRATVASEDSQNVTFQVTSDCEKIRGMADKGSLQVFRATCSQGKKE